MKSNVLILLTLFSLASCYEHEFKTSKTFVGGKTVSADVLNLGKTTYIEYCIQCHGPKGDGKGPSHKGMIPPPRNLKQGLYKFGDVVAGELPSDEYFKKIIKKGLNGSAMLPWDIEEPRLDAVVQYIKTFAPEVWEAKEGELGKKIVPTKDPYTMARKDFAIQKGKEVYHAVAQCYTCHRAYESKANINKYLVKYNGEGEELDDEIYTLKGQESEYEYKILPPDFTFHPLRSIYGNVEDIYVRLVSGINGSGMPSWQETLEDDQIWAVAYYVQSLTKLKKDPEARRALLRAAK